MKDNFEKIIMKKGQKLLNAKKISLRISIAPQNNYKSLNGVLSFLKR